ncbi:MAG: hypothetical protein K2W94_08115 [Alphaproteobacteria bacterium]|nr:hypothetical protein [Alphaproteobacteria bacterium]
MRFKLQVVLEEDEPGKEGITLDVGTFEKTLTSPNDLRLSGVDTEHILKRLRKILKIPENEPKKSNHNKS